MVRQRWWFDNAFRHGRINKSCKENFYFSIEPIIPLPNSFSHFGLSFGTRLSSIYFCSSTTCLHKLMSCFPWKTKLPKSPSQKLYEMFLENPTNPTNQPINNTTFPTSYRPFGLKKAYTCRGEKVEAWELRLSSEFRQSARQSTSPVLQLALIIFIIMSTTALYSPYKAVGYVTDGNPFCINRLGEDTFLTTSVGKAFQVWQRYTPSSSFHLCMLFDWSPAIELARCIALID